MKIIILANGSEVDTTKAVGSALVAAGIAEEVPTGPVAFASPSPCKQEATFGVHRSRAGEPFILASCSCNPSVNYFGPSAHKRARFLHRGGKVDVPSRDVRNAFKKDYDRYVDPPLVQQDLTPGKTVTIQI